MSAEFWRQVDTISLEDIALLLNPSDAASHVYVYDPVAADVLHPEPSWLPWGVLLLLGSKSRKHIHLNSRLPSMSFVNNSISDFLTNVGRAAQFEGRSVLPKWWRHRLKGDAVAPWTGVEDPALRNCLQGLRTKLSHACSNALKRATMGPKFWTAWTKPYELANRWLARNELHAIPSDKDGGVVIVGRDVLVDMVRAKMAQSSYVSFPARLVRPGNLISSAMTLVRKVASSCGEPGLSSFMAMKMRQSCWDRMISTVLLTIKSHKPAGCIEPRVLHAGNGHPFAHVSKMLEQVMRRFTSTLSHLHSSTDSVLAALAGKRFSQNVRFIKLDIKNFYMSGSHSFLAANAYKHVENAAQRKSLSDLHLFILSQQYVQLKLTSEVFYVTKGSGMGQIGSAETADLGFWHAGEHLALRPEALRAAGIEFYARYRDDVFIVQNPAFVFKHWFGRLEDNLGEQYSISLDTMDRNSCPFLDVEFYKGRQFSSGILDFRPYSKPSNQAILLGCDSQHAPHVHQSWPCGEVRRLARRSSTEFGFRLARNSLLAKFRCSNISSSALQAAALITYLDGIAAKKRKVRDGSKWCVLPYHPVFARACLGTIMTKHMLDWWPEIACQFPTISSVSSFRVSWRNGGLPLAVRLQMLKRTTTSSGG